MIMPVVELNDPKGESIELFDDEHKLFKKTFCVFILSQLGNLFSFSYIKCNYNK